MASRICEHLIETPWRSYADDLVDAPTAEGIYTIGVERAGDVRYLYMGQTNNIKRRLQQHKNQSLKIHEFVKKKFRQKNAGKTLRIKWVKERNSKCTEEEYLACMEKNLPFKLRYNMKRGNQCKSKKKISEGRKAVRASKTKDPPLSSRSGSASVSLAKNIFRLSAGY